MSPTGLTFLGLAVIGVLILATGWERWVLVAVREEQSLLVLLGAMGEALLLLIVAAGAGWRRLRQSRSNAHL
jgi:ABC-type proline/glycine betaine transport system permease subunit